MLTHYEVLPWSQNCLQKRPDGRKQVYTWHEKYQGLLFTGRVQPRGPDRVGSTRENVGLFSFDPTRPARVRKLPDPTRPDPWDFEQLLTRLVRFETTADPTRGCGHKPSTVPRNTKHSGQKCRERLGINMCWFFGRVCMTDGYRSGRGGSPKK